MRRAMESVLGSFPGTERQKESAHEFATLPMRLGGVGLRSARRMAPAAFWASWADAFPMLSDPLPELTNHIVDDLSNQPRGCLAQLEHATRVLDRSGFVGRPEWNELRAGRRPPEPISSEPGEWKHGWQYHSRIPFQGDRGVGPVMSLRASSPQIPLGSRVQCSSPRYSYRSGVQIGTPTLASINPGEGEIAPRRHKVQMRVWRSTGHVGQASSCMPPVQADCGRAVGPERTLARVCREAGATVSCNTKLRDMNVAVAAEDERAIVASGLPIRQGAQFAVDVRPLSLLTGWQFPGQPDMTEPPC